MSVNEVLLIQPHFQFCHSGPSRSCITIKLLSPVYQVPQAIEYTFQQGENLQKQVRKQCMTTSFDAVQGHSQVFNVT